MPGGPGGTSAAPIVVDIPGIGVRSFDPKLGLPQIQQNIRILQQEQRQSADIGMGNPGIRQRMLNMALNPEAIAGAASFIPGAGTGTAAAVGAGTSLVRDAVTGHLDPIGSTARAAGHAAVSAVPGAVGGMVAKRLVPKAGEMATAALDGKMGVVRKLGQILMGGGEAAAPGVVRGTAAAAGDLAGMELPGGVAVVSEQGIKTLKAAQVAIANQGKAFGDAQFDALDELIRRATAALAKQGSAPASLTAGAKAGITSATERQAMSSAAAEAAAGERGATISSRLRKLLGLASETADATGMQGR